MLQGKLFKKRAKNEYYKERSCVNLLIAILCLNVLCLGVVCYFLIFEQYAYISGALFLLFIAQYCFLIKRLAAVENGFQYLNISIATSSGFLLLFCLFLIANIDGLLPHVHYTLITGEDAPNLLLKRYISPLLADENIRQMLSDEMMKLLKTLNEDEDLWLRVAWLKTSVYTLCVLSVKADTAFGTCFFNFFTRG